MPVPAQAVMLLRLMALVNMALLVKFTVGEKSVFSTKPTP